MPHPDSPDLSKPYGATASAYVAAGWQYPMPLGGGARGRRARKAPPPDDKTGWDHNPPTEADVEGWLSTHAIANIGVRLPPEVIGIDVDHYDDKVGATTMAALEKAHGKLPPAPRSTSRDPDNPSGIRFYRVPPGSRLRGKAGKDIDVIQHGHRYAVVWPSVHPDHGGVYRWLDRNGNEVTIPHVERLKDLPGAWLAALAIETPGQSRAGSYVDLEPDAARQWLIAHGAGSPCRAVKGVLRAAIAALSDESDSRDGSHYDTAVEAVWAITKLAAEEHRGARVAIKTLGEAYEDYAGKQAHRDPTEWTRMVTGGIAKVAGTTDDMWSQHLDGECPDRPGVDTDKVWPGPSRPLEVAKRFLAEHWTHTDESDGVAEPMLCHWRNDFYRWTGTHWVTVTEPDLESQLYRVLDTAEFWSASKDKPMVLGWNPDKTKISKVMHALGSHVHRSDEADPDASGYVDFTNGALDIDSRALKPHTPTRFNLACLPFAFDPDAGAPRRWLAFLDDVLDDAESIELLAQWFGYLITGETRAQRFLFLLGPSRSGKGTIVRVLESLIGTEAIASPTSAEIASRFGVAPTIGKSLAVIQDASFSGRDARAVVERLKTLTGNDTATIDRKNREAWVGRPTARWMIVSNEMFAMIDSSGALMRRMLGPIETVTEIGDEDINEDLDVELSGEAGAILLWALEGLDRLRAASWKFPLPGVARATRREMEYAASPIRAFIDECVVNIGGGVLTSAHEVYAAYKSWRDAQGDSYVPPMSVFGRDLKSGAQIERVRGPRSDPERTWCYRLELLPRAVAGRRDVDDLT